MSFRLKEEGVGRGGGEGGFRWLPLGCATVLHGYTFMENVGKDMDSKYSSEESY